MRFVRWLFSPGTRGYLYRVVTAGGVLAVAYGFMTAQEAALWAGFVAVLFAVPALNTPTTAQRRASLEQHADEPGGLEPVRWVRRG